MSSHSKSRNNYSKSESNCYNCKEKKYYFSTEGKPSNLSVLNCNYDNDYLLESNRAMRFSTHFSKN